LKRDNLSTRVSLSLPLRLATVVSPEAQQW